MSTYNAEKAKLCKSCETVKKNQKLWVLPATKSSTKKRLFFGFEGFGTPRSMKYSLKFNI